MTTTKKLSTSQRSLLSNAVRNGTGFKIDSAARRVTADSLVNLGLLSVQAQPAHLARMNVYTVTENGKAVSAQQPASDPYETMTKATFTVG